MGKMELTGLTSWLKFDKSPTDDFINSNNWQVYGNPTIGADNAINENALQLDGQSYLKLSDVGVILPQVYRLMLGAL